MARFVVTLRSVDERNGDNTVTVMMDAEDDADAVCRAVLAARRRAIYRVINVAPEETNVSQKAA